MISQNNGGIEKISQTIKNVNMKFNMRLNREILSNHPKQSHYEIFLKFRDTEELYWTIEHKVSLKFLENSVNVGIWSKSPICACTPFDKGKLWCTRHRTSTNQHTRTEQIIIVYLVSVALPRAPNLRSPFQTGRQQEWRHRTGLTQVGNKSAWISLYLIKIYAIYLIISLVLVHLISWAPACSEAWELNWICIQSHPSPLNGAFSLVSENAHSAEASERLPKNPDQSPPHWTQTKSTQSQVPRQPCNHGN